MFPDQNTVQSLIVNKSDKKWLRDSRLSALNHYNELPLEPSPLYAKYDNILGSLELKNREMIDSISSASRIQEAVLPDLSKTLDDFGDFSLIWEPRDIVGGDCYWSVKFENNVWFGLFDCTGHGVPGAFVSLILLS